LASWFQETAVHTGVIFVRILCFNENSIKIVRQQTNF
jgi:hypothetical protein